MAVNRKSMESFIFSENETESRKTLFLTDIKLPSYQPRLYFDEQKLEDLAQTIKAHGILEPLLVRKVNNLYELVAGGRRYRAAKKAKLTEVPVIVKELSDPEALSVAILENLQREDLNPVEETQGILNLLAIELELNINEVSPFLHKLQKQVRGRSANNVIGEEKIDKVQTIFNSLGLMELDSFISNRLPLLNLPTEILEALRSGKIEYTKAKEIAKIKEEVNRCELLDRVISNSLSLSEIRSFISSSKPPKQQLELKNRFDDTYKKVKKAKNLWSSTKKRKQLSSILERLEKLIDEN